MALLMTAFGFLLIFSLYTATQFYNLMNFSLMNQVYVEQFQSVEQKMQEAVNNRAHVNYFELARFATNDLEPPELLESEEAAAQKPGLQPRQRLTRKLHLPLLITQDPNGSASGNSDKKYSTSVILLKNLITELYGQASFFQEAKEKNPRLEDELIHIILQKSFEEKIKLAENLANLHLENEDLQGVLFKMLIGSKKKDDTSTTGYYSLLDFLSFQKRAQAISVYLAPRPILQAVFSDPKIVEDIIATRESIHNKIKSSKKENPMALEEEFKNQFANKLPSDIDPDMIEFKVSSTKP